MNAPQPFPYQGSKRRLAPVIVGYLPTGFARLVEPFAGSAAVSLAVAARGVPGQFLLNDLNQPLMHLWRQILLRPEELADAYRSLWEQQQTRLREFYDEVREEFNRAPRPDLLLYLLARCVKASVRYNAQGGFNQSPDNRRQGMRPSEMRQNLLRTSQCLAGRAEIASVDYRDILAQAQPADVVYMDPPYQGVCGSRDQRYLTGVPFDEFVAALGELNRRNISYVISYDGRTGGKEHGRALPTDLGLERIEVHAGRSSQATLLGGNAHTFESLYLSPALRSRPGQLLPVAEGRARQREAQLTLFGD